MSSPKPNCVYRHFEASWGRIGYWKPKPTQGKRMPVKHLSMPVGAPRGSTRTL